MNEPAKTPRSWLPIAIAGGVAAAVVIGAVALTMLGGRLPAGQQSAAAACEEEFAREGAGEIVGGIVAGEVFTSADWRDLHGLLENEGLADGPAGADEAAALDAWAESLDHQGRDVMHVAWLLEGGDYWACRVAVRGDEADAETVHVAPLSAEILVDAAGIAGD